MRGLWESPEYVQRFEAPQPSYAPPADLNADQNVLPWATQPSGRAASSQPGAVWTPADPSQPMVADGGGRPEIVPLAPPLVYFSGPYAPGTVVIDTSARQLYRVNADHTAYVYPISVGREGFAWQGVETVSRIGWWPDWYPPAEMRQRRPELPEKMLGGVKNPLGAMAIYLGNSLYRIHGTDAPKTIGRAESSGCFRMVNENVVHLASLVQVGTTVVVTPALDAQTVVAQIPEPVPAVRPATRRVSSGGLFDSMWW